jgi:hypothetical protein
MRWLREASTMQTTFCVLEKGVEHVAEPGTQFSNRIQVPTLSFLQKHGLAVDMVN